jgi:hypothetical protein
MATVEKNGITSGIVNGNGNGNGNRSLQTEIVSACIRWGSGALFGLLILWMFWSQSEDQMQMHRSFLDSTTKTQERLADAISSLDSTAEKQAEKGDKTSDQLVTVMEEIQDTNRGIQRSLEDAGMKDELVLKFTEQVCKDHADQRSALLKQSQELSQSLQDHRDIMKNQALIIEQIQELP